MSAYEEDAGVVIAVVAAFVTVPVAADVITARSAKHASNTHIKQETLIITAGSAKHASNTHMKQETLTYWSD